jgi:hypothetical protein
MKKQWVILVSQMVRGKSKAPERNKAGDPKWMRHKPYKYRDSQKDHEILYTRSFTATEADAKVEAKRVNDAMFDTYIMGMGKTDVFCVQEFSVSLHDCTEDVTHNIDGTVHSDDNKLWGHRQNSTVSNKRLVNWGVISIDPSSRSYQILRLRQRKVG